MEYVIIGIIVLALILLFANVRVVPQATEYVIEFLGKYKTTWGAGLHVKVPIIETIAKKITLKEQVLDSPPQPVITKDNVTMQIDTVVYFRIYDAKLYTYGVVSPLNALQNLTATTLRNLVGELELDGTLTSRDTINAKMTAILDEATDKWGMKVNRVELKNIIPPAEIQNAMEKQMKAERERREAILRGIRAIKEAAADAAVLEIKRLETLAEISNGTAAKLIIPTDAVNMVTKNTVFTETTGIGDVTHEAPKPVVPPKKDECCDD